VKRVFLSFAPQDAHKVQRLLPELATTDFELDFFDGPQDLDFDSQDAAPLRQAIGEKISKCSIAVCLITENTHKSKWVDCQLEKSRHKGNRIIAMALPGIKLAVLPQVIREENAKFYPWNPSRLAGLILEEKTNIFNNSL